MKETKESAERFVSTKEGTTIKESQCVSCKYNKGLKCDKYGDKPLKYARVEEHNKCPERKK